MTVELETNCWDSIWDIYCYCPSLNTSIKFHFLTLNEWSFNQFYNGGPMTRPYWQNLFFWTIQTTNCYQKTHIKRFWQNV